MWNTMLAPLILLPHSGAHRGTILVIKYVQILKWPSVQLGISPQLLSTKCDRRRRHMLSTECNHWNLLITVVVCCMDNFYSVTSKLNRRQVFTNHH